MTSQRSLSLAEVVRNSEGGSFAALSRFLTSVGAVVLLFLSSAAVARAQVSVTTYHNDNARTGQNTAETFLTPGNVTPAQFGKLFTGSVNLDSWSASQPLYVPNVTIAGAVHNVVYVATINDSLYAFDADSGALLWMNQYEPPTPYANLCQDTGFGNAPSRGAGIVGTPAIDPVAGVIYFVSKTGNGNALPYSLFLHAVNITTGFDEIGSPVLIVPTSGPAFLPEYHMSRAAVLLNGGKVYVGLGSTGCKGLKAFPKINNHGWILAYNTASLTTPPYTFVTTPGVDNGGIWQGGGGIAADSEGNIYFATADAPFDYTSGGQDLGDSIVKLDSDLDFGDYFTPYNQGTLLNPQDLDLGSTGPVVLPDQTVGPAHLLLATGKAEEIYLINRDVMGEYCNNCSSNTNIVQDVNPPSSLTGCLTVNNMTTCTYGPPSYWNNNLYFPGVTAPMLAYTMTNNGSTVMMGSLPSSQTAGSYAGVGPVSISSNGTSNAIAWSIAWSTQVELNSAGVLRAFDANNVATEFYNSNAASGKRDTLGNTVRYITPTIANGKVYAATESQLVVYGLLAPLTATGGNNQSAPLNTKLPLPLTVQAVSAYTGLPMPGVAVSFSDSNAGGVFGTPNVTTDANGNASSTYTLPKKIGPVVITVSGPTAVTTLLNETALAGPVSKITLISGGGQSATVGTTLPQPIVVAAKDASGDLLSGVSIAFSDGGAGGMFSSNSVVTGSNGQASVSYTLPTKAAGLSLKASASSVSLSIGESAVAGPAASINYVSGNNQFAPPHTKLPNQLVVAVKDQYGNLITGAKVTFSDNGAGGTFSNNGVVTTGSNGRASITYTTGPQLGTANITANLSTLPTVFFTETVD